jgi:hypothetical protein
LRAFGADFTSKSKDNKKPESPCKSRAFGIFQVVETIGIEPMTPCMSRADGDGESY